MCVRVSLRERETESNKERESERETEQLLWDLSF
jgi:hypothetical protein